MTLNEMGIPQHVARKFVKHKSRKRGELRG